MASPPGPGTRNRTDSILVFVFTRMSSLVTITSNRQYQTRRRLKALVMLCAQAAILDVGRLLKAPAGTNDVNFALHNNEVNVAKMIEHIPLRSSLKARQDAG